RRRFDVDSTEAARGRRHELRELGRWRLGPARRRPGGQPSIRRRIGGPGDAGDAAARRHGGPWWPPRRSVPRLAAGAGQALPAGPAGAAYWGQATATGASARPSASVSSPTLDESSISTGVISWRDSSTSRSQRDELSVLKESSTFRSRSVDLSTSISCS